MNAILNTVREVEGFKQMVAVCLNDGVMDDPYQIRSMLMSWVNKVSDLDQEDWEVGDLVEKSISVSGDAIEGEYYSKANVNIVGVNKGSTKPKRMVLNIDGCTLSNFVTKYNTAVANIYGTASAGDIVPTLVAFTLTD